MRGNILRLGPLPSISLGVTTTWPFFQQGNGLKTLSLFRSTSLRRTLHFSTSSKRCLETCCLYVLSALVSTIYPLLFIFVLAEASLPNFAYFCKSSKEGNRRNVEAFKSGVRRKNNIASSEIYFREKLKVSVPRSFIEDSGKSFRVFASQSVTSFSVSSEVFCLSKVC